MRYAFSCVRLVSIGLVIGAMCVISNEHAHAAIPGYEIKSVTYTVSAGNLSGTSVFCTTGKKVLGGGFDIQGAGMAQSYATRSQPAGTQNGWDVNVRNNGTGPVQVKLFAICATP